MGYADQLTFLYGPRRRVKNLVNMPGVTSVMRAVVVDVEDLVDAAHAVVRTFDGQPEVTLTWSVGGNRRVEECDLTSLSIPERNSLMFYVNTVDVSAVHIGFSAAASEWTQNTPDARYQMAAASAKEAGINALLERGTPRANFRRLLPALVWIPLALAWLAFGMTIATASPTPWLIALLALLLVFASVWIWRGWRSLQDRFTRYQVPTRVRSESRAQTHARRADSKRDLRVAALSVAGTVLAGLLVWWITTGSLAGTPTPTVTPPN